MTKKIDTKTTVALILLIVLLGLSYFFMSQYALTWEHVLILHDKIKVFSNQHPWLTPFLFIFVYICYAACSLPGIFILSLVAGYLFDQPWSTFYTVFAATIGASLLFILARSAFGNIFYSQAGSILSRMESGFRRDAANYLLFLRFIPLFPFWLVNLAGAFFGVRFSTFVWTTFVGMIPSVFIYTQAGKGLLSLLESKQPLSATCLLNVDLILGMTGLAFLTLLPSLLRKFKIKFF